MPTWARPQSGILIPNIPKQVMLSLVADEPTNDEPSDAQTLGLRCAWCGKILREPVGYLHPEDHLCWTHGMCRDCQKRVEEDALLPRSNRKAGANEPLHPIWCSLGIYPELAGLMERRAA